MPMARVFFNFLINVPPDGFDTFQFESMCNLLGYDFMRFKTINISDNWEKLLKGKSIAANFIRFASNEKQLSIEGMWRKF